MSNRFRMVKISSLGSVLGLVQVFILFFTEKLEIKGASLGTATGILFGVVVLVRSFHLMKKGIFVDIMTPKGRKITFFGVFPMLIILAVLFSFVMVRYFPEYDLSRGSMQFLTFFILISSLIVTGGIYLLEAHYGNKFYIGKWNE